MKIEIEQKDMGFLIKFHFGFRNDKTVVAESLESLLTKVKSEIEIAFGNEIG